MIIKTFPTGIFSENTYLLIDEESKEAVVIDCGGSFEIVLDEIQKYGATLKYILNTHGHFDHILGEREAQEMTNVPVYIHKEDLPLLENFAQQALYFGLAESEPPKEVLTFDENTTFNIGDTPIKVIHTPGHSKGSCSFLVDNNLFSGDTLFYCSVGRTDLFGGNFTELENSIKNKLFKLDDNVDVYPGHDAKTTIGYEKKYNSQFGSDI